MKFGEHNTNSGIKVVMNEQKCELKNYRSETKMLMLSCFTLAVLEKKKKKKAFTASCNMYWKFYTT